MAVDLDAFFGNSGYKDTPEGFKSGFVTLVGRPNAGKSTLLNALMGRKIAITSDTAQITRHRLRAVLNTEDAQIILVDTPGIHKPHDALGEELNESAMKALKAEHKALVVLPEREENVVRATGNLAEAKTTYVNTLNVYDILDAGKLVVTKAALDMIEEVYA